MNSKALAIAILGVVISITPAIGQTSNENTRALFGDLHLHTAYSFDAFTFKTTATPDDAYKFAKGAAMRHPAGGTVQLKRPLDFLAVTDHSEYMGVMRAMADPNSPLSRVPIAARVTNPDAAVSLGAFFEMARAMRNQKVADVLGDDSVWRAVVNDAWNNVIATANRHYVPGKFTTFIAYEWTSTPDGRHMHRNVIYRGDSAPPPFTAQDSQDPEDLWNFIESQRRKGNYALVIPHNSNLSDGLAYSENDYKGQKITADYARRRSFYERVAEITQIKGTSETHPSLSPTDEFANFEIVDLIRSSGIKVQNFGGSYLRDALRRGLVMYENEGTNPYKYGFIGSSDSHTGMSPVEENNYFGGSGVTDGDPQTRLDCKYCNGGDTRKNGSAGLAAVWAKENTREAIFDALARRESYATSGPRILIRFFAGYDYDGVQPGKSDWVAAGYRRGVPMGGELPVSRNGQSPTFLVWAAKDAESANLDRIQVIKVWTKSGQSFEKVFDVALSGGRKVDPKTGKAPSVGNSVDVIDATYKNNIGATVLTARWRDPEFDAGINAAYYARAIEIPTPRWSTYDAARTKRTMVPSLPATIQERAFTSPIWYDVPPQP